MPGICDLSAELLLMVAGQLDKPSDIHAFALTCRDAHKNLDGLLYHRGMEVFPYIIFWACSAGEVKVVKRLLDAGIDLHRRFTMNVDRCIKRDTVKAWLKGTCSMDRNFLHEVYFHLGDGMDDTGRRRIVKQGPHGRVGQHTVQQAGQGVVEPNGRNRECIFTVLHSAARSGQLSTVKLLIQHGANIEARSSTTYRQPRSKNPILGRHVSIRWSNWTPLHTAISNGHSDVAVFLLGQGANPSCDLNNPQTNALHCAAAYGLTSVAQILVYGPHRLDINERDSLGLSPLAYAHMRENSGAMVDWLLENGADVDLDLGHGCTVLHLTCYHLWYEEAVKLIEAGASVNKTIQPVDSPAGQADHRLVCLRPLELCCGLYAAADIWRDKYKITHQRPLMTLADCFRTSTKLATYLIGAGADVHPLATAGASSPLVTASANRHIQLMDLLTKSGARIGEMDARGHLPLVAAAAHRNSNYPARASAYFDKGELPHAAMSWLIQRGADVNQKDQHSNTALRETLREDIGGDTSWCCFRGQYLQLQVLLHNGVTLPQDLGSELRVDPVRKAFDERNFDECQRLSIIPRRGTLLQPAVGLFYDLLAEAQAMAYCNPNFYRVQKCYDEGFGCHLDSLGLHRVRLRKDTVASMVQDLQQAFKFILVEIQGVQCLLKHRRFLWDCTRYADSGMADILLDFGVRFSLDWEEDGRTVLHNVCYGATPTAWKLAQRLIDGGADVNRGSPALLALEMGKNDLYSLLIKNGANVPFEDS